MREKSGITLVSLVITIIVLLILAGISINTLVGDNGMITKAKEAKENTILAQEEELKNLNQLDSYLNYIDEPTVIEQEKDFKILRFYTENGNEQRHILIDNTDESFESCELEGMRTNSSGGTAIYGSDDNLEWFLLDSTDSPTWKYIQTTVKEYPYIRITTSSTAIFRNLVITNRKVENTIEIKQYTNENARMNILIENKNRQYKEATMLIRRTSSSGGVSLYGSNDMINYTMLGSSDSPTWIELNSHIEQYDYIEIRASSTGVFKKLVLTKER